MLITLGTKRFDKVVVKTKRCSFFQLFCSVYAKLYITADSKYIQHIC